MARLTDETIAAALKKAKSSGADVWKTDETKQRGVGALRLRCGGDCKVYFRYTDSNGKQDSLFLGVYDKTGRKGSTLSQWRTKYGELSRLYQSGHRDMRAYIEHQQAEERAKIESAARERAEAERQAKSGTLKALLLGYIAHLERRKKQSAQDARNILTKNVIDAFPTQAAMRASEITDEDCSAMLAKLISAGHGRTAGKLRAYGRAAYSAALQAKTDPTVHPDLHGFNLKSNPWALVPAKPLAQFNRARERVLNRSELHHFLKAMAEKTGMYPDAVMLSLYLGGQRFAQLVRARPADVDMDGRTITLYDPKGSRQKPRPHVLPLTDRAAEIVARYAARTVDDKPVPYLFTSNNKVPVRTETLSEVVTDISAAMVKAKTAREPFQMRDIRRTCETMLASMGVSRDLRGHVQSHGLGGVQNRHYDKHEYMDEKRSALEAWGAKLREIEGGKPGKVVPLRKKA